MAINSLRQLVESDARNLAKLIKIYVGLLEAGALYMRLLDELEQEISATAEVEASAVTLIDGLIAKLKDAGTDPHKLAELRQTLQAKRESLAAAIANAPEDETSGDDTMQAGSGTDTIVAATGTDSDVASTGTDTLGGNNLPPATGGDDVPTTNG